MCKLYEYVYIVGDNSTKVQYIINKEKTILCHNINNTMWNIIDAKLLLDDINMSFKKNLTNKEAEEIIFLDNL